MSANLETPTADSTPLPEEDNAADETVDIAASDDTAADEDEQSAASDKDVETPETPELEATDEFDDPLAEFEDKPLTRAEIDKMFPRIATAARDLLEKSESARANYLNERAELGGDEGVAFAKAVMPHLFNPKPDARTAEEMMEILTDSNLPLTIGMGNLLISKSLEDERTQEAFGNKLATDYFGPDYTLDKLERLVEWHKRGLMDETAFESAYEQVAKPSQRETQLETQNKELLARLEQIEGKVDSGESAQQLQIREQAETVMNDRILAKITPIADRLGWMPKDGDPPQLAKAKETWAKAFSTFLNAESKRSPERQNAEILIEQGRAMKNGKPSRLMEIQLFGIENRAVADFLAMSRALQPMFVESLRLRSAPRNSKPSEAAKPKTDAPPLPKPAPSNEKVFNPNNVAELDKWLDSQVRDAGVKVGQR